MIELASPNLATKPNGIDLIATNAASYGYIAGIEAAVDPAALDAVHVSLERDGEVILEGDSVEVLAGQRNALVWLINQCLQRGYTISAGHLFMTGSIGGMQPATTGAYHAEFGELGNIDFTLST